MTKTKYYPLRRGFNDALGIYVKRDDISNNTAKKHVEDINSQPEAMKAKGETSIPLSQQYALLFDLY